MNLRDLQYFVAVADLGHFHAAAEKCFVSQPTLSGQLKKLEEELGHSLFERDTRSVRLTAFGREALPLARAVLDHVALLEQKARALRDPFVGKLSVGVFPTLAPWLLPRLVPFLRRQYHQAEFFLIEEKTPVLQKMLHDGETDLAFLALPQDMVGMEALPVFREEFLLAVPAQHPWRLRKWINAEELHGVELLLLEDGHCLRDQALDFCRRFGAREKGYFRAAGLETLRQMVRLGTAITLIPRMAVPEKPESGIKYIPIKNAENLAYRDIGLCFRVTHPRKEFFLDMARRIRASCGQELPVKALSIE